MAAPIVTVEDTFDRDRSQSGSLVPSPGLVQGAAFEEGWLMSPVSSRARIDELDRAGGMPIDSDQFAQKYAQYGLKHSSGMTVDQAEILLSRKKREMRNQRIMADAEGGVFENIGVFGAGLAGAMLDPVNIAASFVPVVGEARFGQLVARLGPFGGRVARGAIEGVVGQAMVEPLTYAAKTQEQAEYGPEDSFANIAMGAVMGATLHGTFGYVSDALDSELLKVKGFYDRQMKDIFMTQADEFTTDFVSVRTGVGQVLDGQPIEVAPIRMLGDAERLDNSFDEHVDAFKYIEGETSFSYPELHGILRNKALPGIVVEATGLGSSKFRARFKGETGPMREIPGIGKTAEQATSRLLDNYAIRFEKQKGFVDVPPEHTQLMLELEVLVRERNMLRKNRDFLMGENFPRDVEPTARLAELDAMVKRFEEMKTYHLGEGNAAEVERFTRAIDSAKRAANDVRKARDFRELLPRIEETERQISDVRRRIERLAGKQVAKAVSKAQMVDNEISPLPPDPRGPLTPRPAPKAPLDKGSKGSKKQAKEPALNEELALLDSNLEQLKQAFDEMQMVPDGEFKSYLTKLSEETAELDKRSDAIASVVGCVRGSI